MQTGVTSQQLNMAEPGGYAGSWWGTAHLRLQTWHDKLTTTTVVQDKTFGQQ